MESVKEFITSKGYNFNPEHIDGSYHEFDHNGEKGWYIGEEVDGKFLFTFGDWRSGQRFHFRHGYTDEDRNLSKLQREQYEKAKQERQLKVAEDAQKTWNDLDTKSMAPYLLKKKIGKLFGCRTKLNTWGVLDLVVPMHDIDGKIWNLQKIQESGDKFFLPGGRINGVFYRIGEIGDVIYVAEGFATGATVHMATQEACVVAFSASNLKETCAQLRRKYPQHPIIVAGDDDHSKTPNTGRDAAEEAAAYVAGQALFPDFGKGDKEPKWTDWNDLQIIKGLNTTREQLKKVTPTKPPEGFELPTGEETEKPKDTRKENKRIRRNAGLKAIQPYINGITPMPKHTNSKGQEVHPPEFEVASELLKYYQGRILYQEGEIFLYDKTHWRVVHQDHESTFRIQIQVLYGGDASHTLVKKTFEIFKDIIPKATRNIYEPNPFRANFLNGTLHIISQSGKWKTIFQPHNPLDYITHVIPIEYDQTRSIRNEKFEKMIEKVVGNDEKEAKIRAIKQMYGACVAPISPKLFLLWGLGGRGKSSVIIPAQRLVHKDNWSAVEPKDFKGFTMESMVGKLVNIVTDIDTTEAIDDANIKKIWDRMPIRIDRKFKTAIQAPLPAVHIFAGNAIPSTYEKGSGAHLRRWVFIELNSFQAGEDYVLNYASDTFDECPVGVLNFALDGLEDLLAGGLKFFSPESSKESVKDWEIQHDPIALFIKDVQENECADLVWDEKAFMKRGDLWDEFSEWHEAAYHRKPRFGKGRFFGGISAKLDSAKKVNGHFGWWGFGVRNAALRESGEKLKGESSQF